MQVLLGLAPVFLVRMWDRKISNPPGEQLTGHGEIALHVSMNKL